MTALQLLLVEDDEDDATLVLSRLRRAGLELNHHRVETPEAMADQLRTNPPDLVISDNSMPRFNAEAALALLRETGLDVPFIVVSGQIGEEAAATLMRAGAHDFVLKGSLARLAPAVDRELREARERQQRRQVQATLDTTEQRFRLVSEHLRDVVFKFRLDPTLALEYVSPAIVDFNGHDPDSLYEDPDLILDAVDSDDRDQLRRSWRSAAPQPLITQWHRPDGSTTWIEQRLIPVPDDGGPAAVEGILRDVTAQIHDAEEREDLARQLHQAERLDSLGQLAGGIAHDFNNLLTVISSHTTFILDELAPGHPCHADAETIAGAAHRAAALTRQLLIFSRLQPANPEDIDVNAVVADIERLLRRTIGEDIDFVIDADPTIDGVTIDRSRLEQLIMNLVVNARAAMPDGGRLTITTASRDDQPPAVPGFDLPPGRLIRLTVADTGHGMDAETSRRAFEPFFTTKGPGQGSGLGLATVYGVVKEAHGACTVQSEPGQGATFTVHLPSNGRPAATAPPAAPVTEPGAAGGERILVIEDDSAVREITCRILTRAGYHITEAPHCDDALRTFRHADGAFDLILSDVVMPGMPVLEFVDAVRIRRPDIPIVFMSGYTEVHGSRTLPDDIPLIAKPFDRAALVDAIRTSLRCAYAAG